MQYMLMCIPFYAELPIFSIIPIFFLGAREVFFQYIESREILSNKNLHLIFFKIFVILQLAFPIFLILISYILSISYKPALFFGISIVTSLVSIFMLLIVLKKKANLFNSLKYIESALISLFLILFTFASIDLFYYHPPRDHHFPTIICSIAYNMPIFFLLFSIFLLFLAKHKTRFFVSATLAIFSLIILVYQYSYPFINYSREILVAIFIPLLFLTISVSAFIESKDKSSLWLIAGSLILTVAFLLSLNYYDMYYLYESLVEKTISQGEFILIGIFESLYLIAFAFMGLGLLGFRKKTEQMEAIQ